MNKKFRVFIVLLLMALLTWQCGKIPAGVPDVLTGFIRIAAQDVSRIDTIRVSLDLADLGRLPNPAVLDGLEAGVHRLAVSTTTGEAITYPAVTVQAGETTEVAPDLDSGPITGPYVGQLAPAFTTTTLTGQEVGSADFSGRVTLLIFMEFT